MNPFEFSRKLAKITEPVIRKLSVEAVLDNDGIVVGDAIKANLKGLTFAGNEITKGSEFSHFTDWFETGVFHDNLQFASKDDIDFISGGGGFSAINEAYPEEDIIAPTAKILSIEAKNDIRKSMIEKIKAL